MRYPSSKTELRPGEIAIHEILRSPRRTVGLEVRPDARLVIRAPLRLPLSEIENIVSSKHAWIIRQQLRARTLQHKKQERNFIDGDKFLFRGDSWPLKLTDEESDGLRFEQGFFLPRHLQPEAPALFSAWYRNEAEKIIPSRVMEIAENFKFKVCRIRLSSASGRWGSCGAGGTLNLNWTLILAAPAVLDYVIAHELAHLREMNHSARFWQEVSFLCPDWQRHRKWLRQHQELLSFP
ncbi:MAG: hypothetical protein A2X49_14075 [Lentisphaerae bacterium GWF2_52_8]|nr:MAG: hypothetical protein A2X49_14075 [Lentisphaerae bacterium GWF2_52_8]